MKVTNRPADWAAQLDADLDRAAEEEIGTSEEEEAVAQHINISSDSELSATKDPFAPSESENEVDLTSPGAQIAATAAKFAQELQQDPTPSFTYALRPQR